VPPVVDEVLGEELAFTGRATSGTAIAGFSFVALGGACLLGARRMRTKGQRS
jgi:hypothetical protein